MKHFSGARWRDRGLAVMPPVQSIDKPPYPGLELPALERTRFNTLQSNMTDLPHSCLGIDIFRPLDSVVYLAIDWGGNPHAVG